jgi:hypothetical protein
MQLLQKTHHKASSWFDDVATEIDGSSDKILSHCKPVVFHRCRLQNCLMSSALTLPSVAREGKSDASSYCLVSIKTGEADKERTPVAAYVRYYLLVQWQDPYNTVDRLARVNIIDVLPQSAADDAAFCSSVCRFDRDVDINEHNDRWIQVTDIVRPVILVKAKLPKCVWKLVQFQGRLLGCFDDCVNEEE